MSNLFVGVLLVCLLTIRYSESQCCQPRDSCVYLTCGCPETPAGVVSCSSSCNNPPAACCGCNSCFRDTCNPCNTCQDKPSPVCSCFNALKSSSCGCDSCSCKSNRIYFPEVEYPNTCIEMNPFYFANCWTF